MGEQLLKVFKGIMIGLVSVLATFCLILQIKVLAVADSIKELQDFEEYQIELNAAQQDLNEALGDANEAIVNLLEFYGILD